MGKQCKQWHALFSASPKSLQMATKAMGLKDTCSWEKSYDKLIQCIKKQRHHFADKVHLVKAMVFPAVMYGCELDQKESWAPKNWYFWTVVMENSLLRAPWTARRSNPSILKEVRPEYSLEGLMLKLKLQYFDHLMWGTDSLEKTLTLGTIEGRRRGHKRRRWLDGITNSMDMHFS